MSRSRAEQSKGNVTDFFLIILNQEGGRLKRNVLFYSCFEFSLSSLGKRRRSTLKATDNVLDERSFQNLKDVEPIGRISGMKKWNVIG